MPVLAALVAAPPVSAAGPWWVPVPSSSPGAELLSRQACVRDHPCQARRPTGGAVSIALGRVVEIAPNGTPTPLRGSPDLGTGATMIAAPATLPAVLVAVDSGGGLVRRSADGSWGRALYLLPRWLIGGVPQITSVAAFDRPITPAVYVATDGYSVLVSNDGGDDWIRAGAELPDRVFALAADSRTQTVFAATSNGLWAHRVQRLPGPPSYADDLLWWRWLGVIGVAAAATALGLIGLWRALPPTAATPSG